MLSEEEKKEKIKEYRRKYYLEHQEEAKEYAKKRYQEKKEYYREYFREYYSTEEHKDYVRNYRKTEKSKNTRREYYIKNKDTTRVINIYLKKYGITHEDYEHMLQLQNEKCAICGKPLSENGKRFSVDHDHISGKVRGLLCSRCNLALGYVKDNIDTLHNMIDYLIKHSE